MWYKHCQVSQTEKQGRGRTLSTSGDNLTEKRCFLSKSDISFCLTEIETETQDSEGQLQRDEINNEAVKKMILCQPEKLSKQSSAASGSNPPKSLPPPRCSFLPTGHTSAAVGSCGNTCMHVCINICLDIIQVVCLSLCNRVESQLREKAGARTEGARICLLNEWIFLSWLTVTPVQEKSHGAERLVVCVRPSV